MVMKKNVNAILLIMVLAAVAAFAGFSVFYQMKFENVTTDYNRKMDQLDKVQNDLLTHKSKLEETEYELEVKSEKEADLSTKYGSIKDERDALASAKSQLESELSQTKQQLTEINAELVQTKFTLETTLKDLQKQTDRANAADNAYDECRDDLDSCQASCSE